MSSDAPLSSEAVSIKCKRHVWDVVGESKPVLVRSNLHHRYYRWYVPVKCARCGTKKTRPA